MSFFLKMRYVVCLLFLTYATSLPLLCANEHTLSAGEISSYQEPLFVSIGPECHLSNCLKTFGYRKAAYPFDWLLTMDHDRMIELLDDDFQYFFDDSYFSISTNGFFIHTYYQIEFRHDSPKQKAKYERRIQRFRNLDGHLGKIFFIRRDSIDPENPTFAWSHKEMYPICHAYALEFQRVLKKRFPHADFNVVIINYSEGKSSMNISDDIITFTIPRPCINCDYCEGLKAVFDALYKYTLDPFSYSHGTQIPL